MHRQGEHRLGIIHFLIAPSPIPHGHPSSPIVISPAIREKEITDQCCRAHVWVHSINTQRKKQFPMSSTILIVSTLFSQQHTLPNQPASLSTKTRKHRNDIQQMPNTIPSTFHNAHLGIHYATPYLTYRTDCAAAPYPPSSLIS